MSGVTWIGGALAASAAAGPIVTVLLLLLGVATGAADLPYGILVILVFALPFGFVVSLIPNMAGTAVLAWAGGRRRTARHPVIWAASGFGLGWLISAAWAAQADMSNAGLGIVGLLCALICRWGTHWAD